MRKRMMSLVLAGLVGVFLMAGAVIAGDLATDESSPGYVQSEVSQPEPLGTGGTFTSGVGVYKELAAPCVLFDTRTAGGEVTGGSTRTFAVVGSNLSSQGGDAAGCGIPSTGTSLHFNLVAIDPLGAGNLKVWDADASESSGGVVNYAALSPGMNNSNALNTAYSGTSGVKVKANGATVDVRGVALGYYMDGGSYFADVDHDHLVAFDLGSGGGGTLTGTYSTVNSVTMTVPDECWIFFTEAHQVLVQASGYVYANGDVNVTLGLDKNANTASDSLTVVDVNLTDDRIPFHVQYLYTDVGSGSQTFNLIARNSEGGTAVVYWANVSAMRLGWDCNFIILSP